MSLLSEVSKGLLQNIELLLNGLNAIQEKYPDHSLNKNRNKSLSKSGSDIEIFGFDLNLILDNLSTIFKNNNTSIADVEEIGHEIKVLQLNIDRWSTRELNNKISCIGRNLKLAPNSFSENDLNVIRNTIQISEIISGSVAIKATITNNPTEFIYRQIVSQVESLQSTLNDENKKRQQFIDQCKLNLDHWLEDTNDKITNILKRNKLALEHSSWLNNWLDYISLKNRLYAQGFENIIDALETSLMQSHDL